MAIQDINGRYEFSGKVTLENILADGNKFSKQGNCQLTVQPNKNIWIKPNTDLSELSGLTFLIGANRYIRYEDNTNASLFEGVVFEARSDISNIWGNQLALDRCVLNMERSGNDGPSIQRITNSAIYCRNTNATTGNNRAAAISFTHGNLNKHMLIENTKIVAPFRIKCQGADPSVNNRYNYYFRGCLVDCGNTIVNVGGNYNPVIAHEDTPFINKIDLQFFIYNNNSDAGLTAIYFLLGTSIESFYMNNRTSIPHVGRGDGDDGKKQIVVGGKKYLNVLNGQGVKIQTISTDVVYGHKLKFDPDSADWLTEDTEINVASNNENVDIVLVTGYSPAGVKTTTLTRFNTIPSLCFTAYNKITFIKNYNSFSEAEATEGTPLSFAPLLIEDDLSVTGTEQEARQITGINFINDQIIIDESLDLQQILNWSKIYEIDNKGTKLFVNANGILSTNKTINLIGMGAVNKTGALKELIVNGEIINANGTAVLTDNNGTITSVVIKGLNNNSECRLINKDDETVIGGVENSSGDVVITYVYKGTDINAVLRVVESNYLVIEQDMKLSKDAQELTLKQNVDRNYI